MDIASFFIGILIAVCGILLGLWIHRKAVEERQKHCVHVWRLYRYCTKCQMQQYGQQQEE